MKERKSNMPMYLYEDKVTGKQVEVLRSFDEYEKLPDAEEAKELSPEEFANAQWVRLVGASTVVKGRGWGLGKGFW
jgi:predicted nucleic acid-binding Zn ribbon protein